jgi:hypothetical protein
MADKQKRTQPLLPSESRARDEEPSEQRRPVSTDPGTSKSDGDAGSAGLAGLTETVTTGHATILHPDEIFRDVPSNTVHKKQAFTRYKAAVTDVEHAERDVESARSESDKAAAERRLNAARARKEAALAKVKSMIVEGLVAKNRVVQERSARLADAKKRHASAERLAELRRELAAYQRELRPDASAEVDAMTHAELGHETESVFEPVDTVTHTFDITFSDEKSERLKDQRVTYATVAPEGLEGVRSSHDERVSHKELEATMEAAGLSAAKRKILAMISGFEGGFDAVNTYDKKVVTWGFVQWAGGKQSDLTQALAIIKRTHAPAFREQFQSYGIDVVADMLVVKRAEGDVVKGDAAAKAIRADPKLTAVLMHAGQDPEIQQGEVAAAAALEIDKVMGNTVRAGEHPVGYGTLFTSEYSVGLLANTAVHSGPGAAQKAVQRAMASYVRSNPYEAGDAWLAGAEAACAAALAALDTDRAAKLGKLDRARGSYQP